MNEIKWESYNGSHKGFKAEIIRHADRTSSVLCFVLCDRDAELFKISFYTKEDSSGYDMIHEGIPKYKDVDTAKAAAEIKIYRLFKILNE